MISSRELRHRIIIQRKSNVKDPDGFTETAWTDYKHAWSKVNGLFGKEYWTAKEYGAESTVVFTMRYSSCPDISINDRILFRSKVFNIVSIDNILFKNEELRIKAEEVI